MGLLDRLQVVGRAALVELRRGRLPGDVVELAAKAAAVEVGRTVAESREVRGTAAAVTVGVAIGAAAGRLRDADIDGALAAIENGAHSARRVNGGRGRNGKR